MQIDVDYLREHYASLSDEALRQVNRGELVEAARKCYDDEVASRRAVPPSEPAAGTQEAPSYTVAPDWLEDPACACMFVAQRQGEIPGSTDTAIAALDAAGIPCQIAVEKGGEEVHFRDEYRVLVPNSLALHARAVLDKEIFNAEMEADWRTHFEALSDDELRSVDTGVICAGLVDLVERLTRAYREELARRNLSSTS